MGGVTSLPCLGEIRGGENEADRNEAAATGRDAKSAGLEFMSY